MIALEVLNGERRWAIDCADVMPWLRKIPSDSVHLVITSPPYWYLRCYGVDGQMGLEPTPEAYIRGMTKVFREVRRVLRPDGCMFVNIGDTYSVQKGQAGGVDKKSPARRHLRNRPTESKIKGLKPKDLCGIPWMLATALRDRFYTGEIENESDRRWMAAMIDAEGCIYISRSKKGAVTGRGRKSVRSQDAFDVGVSIAQRNPKLLEECRRIYEKGRVRYVGAKHWDWRTFSGNARQLLLEVYPFLIQKQQEARLALGCPPSGPQATAAWVALKNIHKGGASDVDFPEPEPLYEPGFYLRQECIWQKPNAMPGSAKDRFSTDHEQVFLFSKSRYYFWDQVATSKPAATATKEIPITSNMRTVWRINTRKSKVKHFASFPPKLIHPMIRSATSEHGCCSVCGKCVVRLVKKTRVPTRPGTDSKVRGIAKPGNWSHGNEPHTAVGISQMRNEGKIVGNRDPQRHITITETVGWKHCACNAPKTGCIVMDPFTGTGTVAEVALEHGQRFIGCDLNPEYVAMANERMAGVTPQLLVE